LALDIAAIVLLALCAALGFKLGFAVSLAKLGGWIGAIVIAIFTHSQVEKFLIAHTQLQTKLNVRAEKVAEEFVRKYLNPAAGAEDPSLGETLVKETAAAAAKAISSHAFTIFVFVGIIAGIALLVFVFTLLFSKKYNDGFAGFFDGFLGLVFGLVGGAALVMLALALLMPLKYVVSPDTYEKIDGQLENSVIASVVYENNPLLETINGFMPNDLDPKHWASEEDGGYTQKQWGELI
jgi:uncharacterized membrane protein required for colicin V production